MPFSIFIFYKKIFNLPVFKDILQKRILQLVKGQVPEIAGNKACAYQGVKNVDFSENLVCFVFFNTCFEICPFALLPTNHVVASISIVASKNTCRFHVGNIKRLDFIIAVYFVKQGLQT